MSEFERRLRQMFRQQSKYSEVLHNNGTPGGCYAAEYVGEVVKWMSNEYAAGRTPRAELFAKALLALAEGARRDGIDLDALLDVTRQTVMYNVHNSHCWDNLRITDEPLIGGDEPIDDAWLTLMMFTPAADPRWARPQWVYGAVPNVIVYVPLKVGGVVFRGQERIGRPTNRGELTALLCATETHGMLLDEELADCEGGN